MNSVACCDFFTKLYEGEQTEGKTRSDGNAAGWCSADLGSRIQLDWEGVISYPSDLEDSNLWR